MTSAVRTRELEFSHQPTVDMKKAVFYEHTFFTRLKFFDATSIDIDNQVTRFPSKPSCIPFVQMNLSDVAFENAYYRPSTNEIDTANVDRNLTYDLLGLDKDGKTTVFTNNIFFCKTLNAYYENVVRPQLHKLGSDAAAASFSVGYSRESPVSGSAVSAVLEGMECVDSFVVYDWESESGAFVSAPRSDADRCMKAVCNLGSGYSFSYYRVSLATMIPGFFMMVTAALSRLLRGGTLFLYVPMSDPSSLNGAMRKLLHFTHAAFDDFQIHNSGQGSLLFEFRGFRDDVPPATMDALRSISVESRPYNHNLCEAMRHMHYLLKRDDNRDKEALGYRLDLDEVGLRDAFEGEEPVASMLVLDDVELPLPFEPTLEALALVAEVERVYREFDRDVYHKTERYVLQADPDDYRTMYVEEGHREQVLYERTKAFLKYFEKNGLAYNKANLAYIKEYNKATMNRLFALDNNIMFRVVDYGALGTYKDGRDARRSADAEGSSPFLSLSEGEGGPWRSYGVEELEEVQRVTEAGHGVKQFLVEKYESENDASVTDAMRRVKAVSEDFTRGVSAQASRMLARATRGEAVSVSNAFVKLWEIYASVPEVARPRGATMRVFHIAEAPGQWIYSTTHYLRTRGASSGPVEYDWRAMSLDAAHPANRAKYGDGIFADQYGFIRKSQERWAYGADGTGDFTNPDNIMWYRAYVREWCGADGGPDLVTGDAGMSSGEGVGLRELQLIDLCQMLMVLACGAPGGACVTKHFLPYIRNIPESLGASGFFLNLLYCYALLFGEVRLMKPHTSNPDSGEFYVVCTGMRPVSDAEVGAAVGRLRTFETNGCLFEEASIPAEFRLQVLEFVRRLSDNISEQYEIQNTLLTCLTDDSEVIQRELQCARFLDPERMAVVKEKRVEKWIEMFSLDFDRDAIVRRSVRRGRHMGHRGHREHRGQWRTRRGGRSKGGALRALRARAPSRAVRATRRGAAPWRFGRRSRRAPRRAGARASGRGRARSPSRRRGRRPRRSATRRPASLDCRGV